MQEPRPGKPAAPGGVWQHQGTGLPTRPKHLRAPGTPSSPPGPKPAGAVPPLTASPCRVMLSSSSFCLWKASAPPGTGEGRVWGAREPVSVELQLPTEENFAIRDRYPAGPCLLVCHSVVSFLHLPALPGMPVAANAAAHTCVGTCCIVLGRDMGSQGPCRHLLPHGPAELPHGEASSAPGASALPPLPDPPNAHFQLSNSQTRVSLHSCSTTQQQPGLGTQGRPGRT